MSVVAHTVPRRTRLRDFGAFQAGITTRETQEWAALDVAYWHETPTITIPAVPTHENRLAPRTDDLEIVLERSVVAQGSDSDITMLASTGSKGDSGVVLRKQADYAVSKATPKKWISLAFRVGCTLLLFALLSKSLSWSSLLATLGQVRHGVVLMGLTIGAFGIVVSSYQWRSLLRAERIQVDLAELIELYMVGVAFSHFLPTGMGGDAIKAVYVGRRSGNSAGSASAVVMSRVTGFFGMLLIALPVLMLWHDHIAENVIVWFVLLGLLVGGMIGAALFCVTILPRFFRKVDKSAMDARRLIGYPQVETPQQAWLKALRFIRKDRIFASVVRMGEALRGAFRRPRLLCGATLFGIEFWIVGCLNYYSYANALGMNVPLYFYFVAIPFVSLLTFLPISINGFGVREGAFVYIFSTMHVPATVSLLLVLLMDMQVLLFGIIGGCIYLTMGTRPVNRRSPQAN